MKREFTIRVQIEIDSNCNERALHDTDRRQRCEVNCVHWVYYLLFEKIVTESIIESRIKFDAKRLFLHFNWYY